MGEQNVCEEEKKIKLDKLRKHLTESGFKVLSKEEHKKLTENKKLVVKGLCRKCNTEQLLEIRDVGDKEICFWCPKCKDQIDKSAVDIPPLAVGELELE